MMKKISWSAKLTAFVLSALIIFSAIPTSVFSTIAVTKDETDFVSISVVDTEDNPVSDANVNYSVDSESKGKNFISKTEKTDKNGVVKVMSSSEFIEDDMTITASVSKDKFKEKNTIKDESIKSDNQVFKVTLESTVISDIDVIPTVVKYDGEEHSAATVNYPEGKYNVEYRLDNGEWQNTIPKIKEPKKYQLEVKATKDGYDTYDKVFNPVVELNTLNLQVEEYNGDFDNSSHAALAVKGLKDDDKVTCRLNNSDEQEGIPQISKVGTYKVSLTVERKGYTKYSKVFSNIEIKATDVKGVEARANNYIYDGNFHDAVTVNQKNVEANDKFQYKLNDGDWSDVIPQIKDVGEYKVQVKIFRDNYNETNVEVIPTIAVITDATQTLKFVNNEYNSTGSKYVVIDENNNKYDFSAIDDDTQTKNAITYSIDNSSTGKGTIDENGVLTVTDVGSIVVVATKKGNDGYKDTSISFALLVKPKSEDLINFDSSSVEYTLGTNNGLVSDKTATKVYNDSDMGGISYSIANGADIGLDCNSITGKVTVENYENLSKAITDNNGKLAVTVNVKKADSQQSVDVESKKDTNTVYFSDAYNWKNIKITYWINGNSTTMNMNFDHTNGYGQKVYSCEIPNNANKISFSGNSNNKTVDINNGIKNGSGYYPVSKDKTGLYKVGSYEIEVQPVTEKKLIDFPECTVSYEVTISFANTPANPYEIDGEVNDNGWYKSKITVKPTSEEYQISKSPEPSSFVDSVNFDNNGDETTERIVYLRNKESGAITAPIFLQNVKIDTEEPKAINIDYSDPVGGSWWKESLGSLSFGFYNPTKDKKVKITFSATDEVSGIDYFTWNFNDGENKELSKYNGKKVYAENGKATIELPENEADQLRGHISVTATDKAGNDSEVKDDSGKIIVSDTVSPTCEVNYEVADKYNGNVTEYGDSYYYNCDINATVTVTEANFFPDEKFVLTIKNDNETTEILGKAIVWSNDENNKDKHTGKFTLSGDGDYNISIKYTDKSGNEMTEYKSKTLVIDKTKPVLNFKYDENNQKTTFTVTEHNFRAKDIKVDVTAKDINRKYVKVNDIQSYLQNASNWTKVKDKEDQYTLTLDNYVDAIYSLVINYKDISGNDAEAVTTDEFIMDKTAPTKVKVTYSKSLLDTILENITFGFYNPNVKVTFTSYDQTSGVKDFKWNYIREKGVSETNRPTDETISVLKDKEVKQNLVDKSLFTSSITLPKNKAEQLRGYLAVTATDNKENNSSKVTDKGHIIVVDTISPKMTVEYSKASRTVGKKMYYNKSVTATFTVTEANFYKNDVKVYVSKNGEKPIQVSPKWVNNSTDIHTGTLVLNAPKNHKKDGHYIISVKYKDRSNNSMKSYKSNIITIDTLAPTVNVKYSNKKPVDTLKDSENHNRKYFDKVQTATVTINEHNFNAKEVKFDIVAKDVTGKKINSHYKMSKWKTVGDKHTIVITYEKDANYSFNVSYTDLATNKMADYKTDYFTVDMTSPTSVGVEYSSSVMDTVLNTISFGFYQEKVKVTLNAFDNTTKINKFDYSYINAKNISYANAELLNQILSEAEITYYDNNRGATTSFEIPRGVLDSNHQFNGTVEFTAFDRSNNHMEMKDDRRVVVDNIAPTAQVNYNQPVNSYDGIDYYDGNINASINIDEANFYSEDVDVSVTKDGSPYPVSPSWKDSSQDYHIGTFTLTEDGDYFVTVNYKDKSSNSMRTYKSNQLTIDTKIDKPIISINGNEKANGTAYKDKVVPAISFSDKNYDSYEAKLTRTSYGKKDVDVTKDFLDGFIDTNEKGGSGTFDTFKKIAGNDGIYTLTVEMKDKANHSSKSTTTFTVNRYGSVYEYDNYLSSLIKNGGNYIQKVNKDLVVTEYNADKLVAKSLDIEITRDGKPLDNLKYTTTPTINDKVKVGSSGWYQYKYVISKDNFNKDGIYKITIASKDATGNTPENNNYKNKVITFRVDSTPPEITSIVGLEEPIINAQTVTGKYSVYDTIGLKSITVYIDGKQYGNVITDFKKDQNNYSGSFTLNEKSESQSVRLVIKDIAGNVTDTNDKSFTSEYVFNKQVTVSTNFFVRWYANKPLVIGSICGVVVVLAGIGLLIGLKTKKKKKD